MAQSAQAAFDFGRLPDPSPRIVNPEALSPEQARDAASQGFDAGRSGQPDSTCPYQDGDARSQALARNWKAYWALGLREALRTMD